MIQLIKYVFIYFIYIIWSKINIAQKNIFIYFLYVSQIKSHVFMHKT
jgi:hypothetical protein